MSEIPESNGAEAPEPEPIRVERLTFTGTGAEYFRIWIVNLALTIVTLGVYSAWAKVRRMQYFYRHTRLAGVGFDYHGDPIAILKGRVVGLVLFGLYSAIGYVNIWVGVAIIVGLATIMPWLLGRSLRFTLHNSSYRGIRFKFHGTTKQSYWVFLALPILTIFSLFTLGPFWHHRLKRYEFSNAAYGRSRFSMTTGPGEFYITYILGMFVFFCLVALFVGVIFGGVFASILAGQQPEDNQVTPGMVLTFALAGAVYAMAIIAMQSITAARIQNACWNEARTDHHTFDSTVSAWQLFFIQYTNLWATVLTLGFFRPFAQVRLARYTTGAFAVIGRMDFEAYTAAESDDVSATGAETADLFDFDIAF